MSIWTNKWPPITFNAKLSNARNDRETMMSQSQFDSLLDRVKNQMVFSIKERIIPYVDKLANNQSQGQQRLNEEWF